MCLIDFYSFERRNLLFGKINVIKEIILYKKRKILLESVYLIFLLCLKKYLKNMKREIVKKFKKFLIKCYFKRK